MITNGLANVYQSEVRNETQRSEQAIVGASSLGPAGSVRDFGGLSELEVLTSAHSVIAIPHEAVRRAAERVQKTGIADRLHEWRVADGLDRSNGGRPAMIGDLAILTSLLLMTGERKALLMTELARLLRFRLTPESRELLGVPTAATAFAKQLAEERNWYNNTRNAFQRIVETMNPYPYDIRHGKTHVAIKGIVDSHDFNREREMKERLDEFTERFLMMTFREQPRDIRRVSREVSVSLDHSYLASANTRAYSRSKLNQTAAEEAAINDQGALSRGIVDVSAGFYPVKEANRGDHKRGTPGNKQHDASNVDFQVGYSGNFAIRVDAEDRSAERFPHLIVGATISVPNEGVAEEAVRLLRSALGTGLTAGVADADKEYFANAIHERLHEPAVELGFTPSTDYRKDRKSISAAPGGALYVDDSILCPSAPKVLQTATHDHLNGIIDTATFRIRIEERQAFKLRRKEKPDSAGRVPMMCPALGASPTLTCPVRELAANATKKVRPAVDESDVLPALPDICVQHSVSFQQSEIQKRTQRFTYGTAEWESFHQYARNGIESTNAALGEGKEFDIESATRRRSRGLAAAQLLTTFLVVQHNLQTIAQFLLRKARRSEGLHVPSRKSNQRARDTKWANPYVGTRPKEVIPIALSSDDPPLRT
jgi:hypothetical protein